MNTNQPTYEMKSKKQHEFISPLANKNGLMTALNDDKNGVVITPTTEFNTKALENTYANLKKKTPLYKRPRVKLFLFTLLWLLAGMLYFHFSKVQWEIPVNGEDDDDYYKQGNELPFVYSVFFCLQLLLGIGFGPRPKLSGGNETVIVIYILLGSSLLTSFVIYLIDRIATKVSVVEKSVKDGFDASSWEMGAIKSKVASKSGKNISRTLRASYIFGGLIIYILIGALVLLAFEPQGNYGKNIFFLITSLSTVGLIEPVVTTSSLTFLSIYIAIGVPFYALVLSEYAALLSFNNLRDKLMKEEIERRRKNEEEFWERISDVQRGSEGDLEYAEFLELELLRIGNLNLSALHVIRKRYENEVDFRNGESNKGDNNIYDNGDYDELEYRKSIRNTFGGEQDEDYSGDHVESGYQSEKISLSSPSKKVLSTFRYLNNPQRANTLTLENSVMQEDINDSKN